MIMRALLFPLWLSLCLPAQAVEVYKDAEGEDPVRYSDQPFPDSRRYDVPPLPTYSPPDTEKLSGESSKTDIDARYKALRVANIQNNEPVRANNGNVTVKLALEPELNAAADHRFVLLLDGKERKQGETPTLQLINLDRGRHTLQAMVVDAGGQELIRSERVYFYVKRVSVLLPQR